MKKISVKGEGSLVLHHSEGSENLGPDTLVFAIDDTGHERFADPAYPVFGLGGCGFLVRDYRRLIETPWNYMCNTYFPNVTKPMHASELPKLTPEQLEALTHYFEKFEFFRIACTISRISKSATEFDLVDVVGSTLLKRMCDVAKWVRFDRVFVLVEQSQRIQIRILHSLANRQLKTEHPSPAETPVRIKLGIMPKASGSPALEVADFVIHTAGTQTRARSAGKLRKDFEIVFRNVDERLTSFFEITAISGQ